MSDHNVGTALSGRSQQDMQIRSPVLERGGLIYQVAAARREVLFTLTSHDKSPWTIVGAYPVGFGDRRQHRLLGPVERLAPRFGPVSGPRHEHDRGRAFALALHIHLAAPTDIDQAGKVLVMARVTLTGVALGGVVAAPATSERRGGSSQHDGQNSCQHHDLPQHTISSLSCIRAFDRTVAPVPEVASCPGSPAMTASPFVPRNDIKPTPQIGPGYRPNGLD